MPVLMLAAVASGVLVVMMLYRARSTGFLPSAAGLALLFVVIAITVLFEVPVNNQVRAWTLTSLPVDWKDIRERWALLHLIRTFTSLAALALFLSAAIFIPPPAPRKQP